VYLFPDVRQKEKEEGLSIVDKGSHNTQKEIAVLRYADFCLPFAGLPILAKVHFVLQISVKS
jgi:hypothetical protein